MNNFYGMGGQPLGETMGIDVHRPHRRRRESRADARRARQRLRPAARHRRLPPQEADPRWKAAGRCCSTRSPTASAAIRRRTRRATARRRRSSAGSRPIRSAPSAAKLLASGAVTRGRARFRARVRSRPRCSTCSSSPSIWRRARASSAGSELVGEVMFSNRRVEKFDDRAPEFLQSLDGEPARAADSRQDPHPHGRRQARARR